MPKLLLVTFSLSGGGAQAVCRTWANEFIASGHEVEIAVLDPRSSRPHESSLTPGARTHLVQPESNALRRVIAVRRLIRVGDYDAVFSLETYPNLVALIATQSLRSATPVIISEHNVATLILRAEGIAKRIQLGVARILYRRSAHCIAVSHATATDLRCNFGVTARRLSVIPNAALPDSTKDARQPQDFSRVRVIVPARFVPQKRPEVAWEICALLANQFDSVHLVWIGDPTGCIDNRTSKQRNFTYSHLPWSESWLDEADDATVVMLPSAYEGLGNVLLQAAERGIPTVAGSGSLGCADAIVPGATGELAEADTPSAYAQAILRALATNKNKDGIQRWLAQFRPSVSSEKLHRLLSTVLYEARGVE